MANHLEQWCYYYTTSKYAMYICTLLQKKRKMDSVIIPGVQGHGPVTLGHVEYAKMDVKPPITNQGYST